MKKILNSRMLRKVMVMTGIMSAISGTAVVASASDFNITTTMTTAFQSLVTDLLAMLAAVLPIGLTVLAASLGITFGIKWIKKIAGKS
ncbi:MAG: hypothetical protein FWD38_09205 [Oscillospiraceae bacterium]|nr:hypothetical protein [Oscillospiraceae bacterium]